MQPSTVYITLCCTTGSLTTVQEDWQGLSGAFVHERGNLILHGLIFNKSHSSTWYVFLPSHSILHLHQPTFCLSFVQYSSCFCSCIHHTYSSSTYLRFQLGRRITEYNIMAMTMASRPKPFTNFIYDGGCRQDQRVIDTLPSPPLSTVSPSSSSSPLHSSDHDSDCAAMTCDLNIQSALELARNSEDDIDIKVNTFLEEQIKVVWHRLQAQPTTYIMDRDEFALFNFYIYRFRGSEITEKAIDRFWRSHRGSATDS